MHTPPPLTTSLPIQAVLLSAHFDELVASDHQKKGFLSSCINYPPTAPTAGSSLQRELPHQGERRRGGHPAALHQSGPEGTSSGYRRAALQRNKGGGELLAHRRWQGGHRPLGEGKKTCGITRPTGWGEGVKLNPFDFRLTKWSGGAGWSPQIPKSTPRKSALRTQR